MIPVANKDARIIVEVEKGVVIGIYSSVPSVGTILDWDCEEEKEDQLNDLHNETTGLLRVY